LGIFWFAKTFVRMAVRKPGGLMNKRPSRAKNNNGRKGDMWWCTAEGEKVQESAESANIEKKSSTDKIAALRKRDGGWT